MRPGMLVQPVAIAAAVILFEDHRYVGELRRGSPGLVVDVVHAPTPLGVDRVQILADGVLGWAPMYALEVMKE